MTVESTDDAPLSSLQEVETAIRNLKTEKSAGSAAEQARDSRVLYTNCFNMDMERRKYDNRIEGKC